MGISTLRELSIEVRGIRVEANVSTSHFITRGTVSSVAVLS